jgi:hypothetical protein
MIKIPTYVLENAWHSSPFLFHFSAHLLPLFDLRVELSISTIMDKLACLSVTYLTGINTSVAT